MKKQQLCRTSWKIPQMTLHSGAVVAATAVRQKRWNVTNIGCGTHLQKALVQGLLSDVQHFRIVNATIVEDLLDDQPEREGGDVQHVQQGGFAGTHFVSGPDELHITLRK